jgi:hypothetical protein
MRITIIFTLFVVASSFGCSFSDFECKSRQSEVKAGLKAIQAGMVASHAEDGRYPRVLQATGFAPKSDNYDFKVVKADDSTGFLVEATGKGKMVGDRWQIDQLGELTAVADACK